MTALAVVLTCGAIIWALDLFRLFGFIIYTQQYLSGMLAVALPLIYLQVPAGKGRERGGPVPWYDLIAAVVACAVSSYTSIRYPILAELIAQGPLSGFVTALIMLILLIEGLRRTAGNSLTVVVLFFIGLALVGHRLPEAIAGIQVDFNYLIYFLAWDPAASLGMPMIIVTTIVPAFIFFGQILFKSGGSSFFTDIAMALMGRFRGGPAKISIFASGFFGSISGSVVSNVVTTGVITIPMMKKGGFLPRMAGAIEAVASSGGQLMPPIMGAAAFVMAELLEIPYTQVVVASLIPSFLYYAGLFIQADLEAARLGISRVEKTKIPAFLPVIKAGWFFPLPFAVIIGALFWLNYSPETSAFLGAAVLILLGFAVGHEGKRLRLPDVFEALRSTGLAVLDILMIGAAAGMVIGVLNISGIGFGLTLAIIKIAGGSLILLLLMAAVACIILGMGMPTVAVYVLVATLVAPALIKVGIDPMAAHLFVLYYGMMSMITPPVAIGAYAAATLAKANPIETGFAAMRFGWVAFVVPFIFVFSPTLIMKGHSPKIAIDLLAALGGIWLVCIAMTGYFVRHIGWLRRLLYILAGLALLWPTKTFGSSSFNAVIGFALGALLIGQEFLFRYRNQNRGGTLPDPVESE